MTEEQPAPYGDVFLRARRRAPPGIDWGPSVTWMRAAPKKDEDVTAANIRTGRRGDEIAVVRIRRLLTSITGDYETGVGSLLGSFCQDFDGINWLALVLSRIQEWGEETGRGPTHLALLQVQSRHHVLSDHWFMEVQRLNVPKVSRQSPPGSERDTLHQYRLTEAAIPVVN